jgi:hypothetical protein
MQQLCHIPDRLLIYGSISKNFSGRFMVRENMQQYPVVIGIIHRYIQSTLDNEQDFDKCQFYHTKIFNVYF